MLNISFKKDQKFWLGFCQIFKWFKTLLNSSGVKEKDKKSKELKFDSYLISSFDIFLALRNEIVLNVFLNLNMKDKETFTQSNPSHSYHTFIALTSKTIEFPQLQVPKRDIL